MIRNRKEADLVPWIAAASDSLTGSFASGVTEDIAAVQAALVQPWSNGQTEGQITKLKRNRFERPTSRPPGFPAILAVIR